MTKEIDIKNDTSNSSFPSPQNEVSVKPLTSLFKVALWLIVLLYAAQILIGFIGGIYIGYQNAGEASASDIQSMFTSVPVLLTMTILAAFVNIPLLSIATPANNWRERFTYWAINFTSKKETVKWLIITCAFWLAASFIGELVNLPVEQFMLTLKAATDSVAMLLLIIAGVCIVAPIMEELIFRGWLFSKVAQTRLGRIGALILTSLIFTAIHSHYDHLFTFFILFAFGLLLGFMRYKTNNIVYCVISHIAFNSLAMFALLYFDI